MVDVIVMHFPPKKTDPRQSFRSPSDKKNTMTTKLDEEEEKKKITRQK